MTTPAKPLPPDWSQFSNLEVHVQALGEGAARDTRGAGAPHDVGWRRPAPGSKLLPGQLHLWRAYLDVPAASLPTLVHLLSLDELYRAGRFHFGLDRRRFIVCRGLLRLILGQYLDTDPALVCFTYGDFGKPCLDPHTHGSDLQFNLAHSGSLAIYALTLKDAVGVDLEWVRPIEDQEEETIARCYFSEEETRALKSAPAYRRHRVFFETWTRHEAWLKATGQGLAGNTPCNKKDSARSRKVNAPGASLAEWWFQTFTPFPGHLAALAVKGT